MLDDFFKAMDDKKAQEAEKVKGYAQLRRLRMYTLYKHEILQIFGTAVRITGPHLPKDATVSYVAFDHTCDCFMVAIRSDSFEVVPDGEVIPPGGNVYFERLPRLTADPEQQRSHVVMDSLT